MNSLWWYSARHETARSTGESVGNPGAWVPVDIPAVTVIRVVDGLVIEHHDHADCDEMLRRVADFTGPGSA